MDAKRREEELEQLRQQLSAVTDEHLAKREQLTTAFIEERATWEQRVRELEAIELKWIGYAKKAEHERDEALTKIEVGRAQLRAAEDEIARLRPLAEMCAEVVDLLDDARSGYVPGCGEDMKWSARKEAAQAAMAAKDQT